MQRTINISNRTLRYILTIQRKYYTSKNGVFYKITYYSTGVKIFEKRRSKRDDWQVMTSIRFDNYLV